MTIKTVFTAISLLTVCAMQAVAPAIDNSDMNSDNPSITANRPRVLIRTTVGDIEVELYNDTPLHRDNFLKLVDEKFYDGLLFHRVVRDFVVQAGDPESRAAESGQMLGSGGPGYDIDAEIVTPEYFHKRGALAAAREGDETNPQRRSSGSQFYIVTGKVFSEGRLSSMERQKNLILEQEILSKLTATHRDSIMSLRRNRDLSGLSALQDELIMQAEEQAKAHPFVFTPEQRVAYTTVGGNPNLDGAYTVFGEVVSGMETVDEIQRQATDGNERPLVDVRIISMEVVSR